MPCIALRIPPAQKEGDNVCMLECLCFFLFGVVGNHFYHLPAPSHKSSPPEKCQCKSSKQLQSTFWGPCKSLYHSRSRPLEALAKFPHPSNRVDHLRGRKSPMTSLRFKSAWKNVRTFIWSSKHQPSPMPGTVSCFVVALNVPATVMVRPPLPSWSATGQPQLPLTLLKWRN